jgi:hypothetical protein
MVATMKKHVGMYESFRRCDAISPSGHRCRMSVVNHKTFQGREVHHCWGPRNFREVWQDGTLPTGAPIVLTGPVECEHEFIRLRIDEDGNVSRINNNNCPDCGADLRKGEKQ